MAHEAIVARLTNVREHPNADRLKLATVAGYQIIVGIDNYEGQQGVFFYPELQLSEEFCAANDLIGYTDPMTGEKKGGYFARNRRVRSQRLRGEKSEGYWTSLDSFDFTGYDMSQLKEGALFAELNGVPICNKYFTPATLKAMANRDRILRSNPCFAKHVETEKFQYNADKIPNGSMIYITEKLHGTSGRYGYVMDKTMVHPSRFRKFFGAKPKEVGEYDHLIGTRNVILGKWEGEDYYGNDPFRVKSVKNLEGNLRKGEVLYYEIVGYTDSGALIMGEQDTSVAKDIKKLYKTDKMRYTYGCIPGQCKIYVYRITQVNEDGHAVELSWNQVKKRCGELGVSHVPELEEPIYYHSKYNWEILEELKKIVETLMVGSSTLDDSHIREGVVLRCEQPNGETEFYKSKSFEFGLLEGYLKEKDDSVDLEEIS